MADWTNQEITKAMNSIAKRAARDPKFRQLALSDPNKAIAEIAGKTPPPGYKVRFVEAQGARMVVSLPDPTPAGKELTDDQLEDVAGGGRCGGSCAASCGVSDVKVG
jgi:hypothetical protein